MDAKSLGPHLDDGDIAVGLSLCFAGFNCCQDCEDDMGIIGVIAKTMSGRGQWKNKIYCVKLKSIGNGLIVLSCS
ncbi:unnamed protein product [Euphydryas editha]|uniref:Uncharacterized protein n=1 Tax=Euphydryas editha TaxID=104508 RepID=A0AAU9TK02_EUPED|nr:unnamed protein product [Euphydryas editha]